MERMSAAEGSSSPGNEFPLVSIGLPVYNGERYLRDALPRLISQDYPNFELIVSDNASTDNTAEICKEYSAVESRIRYIRQETNLGAIRNFNKVFELSSGKYFMWAAYDDWWDSSYVSKCVARLEQHPEAIICGSYFRILDENGNEIKHRGQYFVEATSTGRASRISRLLRFSNPAFSMYSLIRSEGLRDTPKLRGCWGGDLIMISELCLRGTIITIPEYLFGYRVFANKSFRQIVNTLDPANKDRSLLVLWKELYVEVLKAIYAFPMSRFEKFRVLAAAALTLTTHWGSWITMSLNDNARKYLQPAIENRAKGNRKLMIYYGILSLVHNPLFLFSLGPWAIIGEGIIGPQRAAWGRRKFRSFFPRSDQTATDPNKAAHLN